MYLPDIIELPVQHAHGPRVRIVFEPSPVCYGRLVDHRLLDLSQVRPPPEAAAGMTHQCRVSQGDQYATLHHLPCGCRLTT